MRKLYVYFAVALGTGLGLGFMPFASGTFGSLLGVGVLGLFGDSFFSPFDRLILWGLAIAVGFWSTWETERFLGRHDDGRIVVDEVAGQIISLGFLQPTPTYLIASFFLFRLFDIWKPWPIRWIDEQVPGATGTFFDDILAAVYAAVCLHVAVRFGVLS